MKLMNKISDFDRFGNNDALVAHDVKLFAR